MTTNIGFIGLGIMGKPMARNLRKAGFPLIVYNRSRPAMDELAAEGAALAQSPRKLAARSDVVITMLPDSPDVAAVLRGADGVFAGARPDTLLIDMSTIAPGVARELAAEAASHGLPMLDAPVSGGDKGAIAGTLSIMVGGESAAFERAQPLLSALGKTITHCGASGSGQLVKACNQVAVAVIIGAVAEALELGQRAGVDPEIVLRVLGGGLAQNRVLELRGPNMARGVFEPGFKARLHQKDLNIVLDTAASSGAALPFTRLASQGFAALIANGQGDLDHSALLTVLHAIEQPS
ncbi:MAG: 2-hydroxy-3-oxopropionate reductase [Chloroflexaceae bacterium]|jgi:2-hydroxy-3-oxopropionate reductase|nr:2-hydroxy-3-oxopropionate reductase [Chloroflexaceae bacterium]